MSKNKKDRKKSKYEETFKIEGGSFEEVLKKIATTKVEPKKKKKH